MMGHAAAATHVLPGTVLVGKYRVERVLGKGGMGIVVAAHHLHLDEMVAIKFLLHGDVPDAESDARFLREAQAAVKIKSEHVARVTDVGRLESGAPYMVMEYLEGRDLASLLAEHGPMPVERAVDFLLQACEAIAEAHSLGIVHRDLKPANLFCVQRRDGALSIKVLDFGISKQTIPGNSGHDVTTTATIFGSPAYMSPEQLRASKDVDARADIWSLGVIFYELVAGKTPFASTTLAEMVFKIGVEPPTPLRAYRTDLPAELERIIGRCLEKDRDRRTAHVDELASALARYGSRSSSISVERIRGTKRATYPSSPQLGGSSSSEDPERRPATLTWGKSAVVPRPRRASSALVVAVGMTFLVVVAVSGVFLVRAKLGAATADGLDASPVTTAPAVASSMTLASHLDIPTAAAPATAASVASALDREPDASTALQAPVASASGDRHVGGALRANATSSGHARVPGCDPPYTLDDMGRKQFKPQCFAGH